MGALVLFGIAAWVLVRAFREGGEGARVAELVESSQIPQRPGFGVVHWCRGCDGLVGVERMSWSGTGEWLCGLCVGARVAA